MRKPVRAQTSPARSTWGTSSTLLALLACISWTFAQTPSRPQSPPPVPEALDTPSVKTAPSNTPQPPTLLLDTPSVDPPSDMSATASPVAPERRASTLPVGTAISVQMTEAVSSGGQRNGDTVHALLAAPLQTSTGSLPRGTPVQATVVSAARAGTMASAGVLSLQLTRVGTVPIITDVVDFNGQEGHKDVADSAPQKGTEALVQAGALLQFHVMQNGPATGLAPNAAPAAGSLDGSPGNSPGSPAVSAPAASPNSSPGANQRPIQGTTRPINPPAGSPPML